MTEEQLIENCKNHDRKAQKLLYEKYSPRMFGLSRRYVSKIEDAEDVLLEAFFKIFTKIDQYKGKGSFEGWMRRIVINESLMYLRKHRHFKYNVEINDVQIKENSPVEGQLAAQDILHLLDQLPKGYRTIFTLYVVEGYKHREIAEILGISINTSKSQLILAKKRMKELLAKYNYPGVKI